MNVEAVWCAAAGRGSFVPVPLGSPEEGPEDLLGMIDQAVASAFDIDVHALLMPSRGQARIALARQVAMYLAHVGCGLTFTEVGDVFGRDRTTVAHACSVIEQRRDDEAFDQAMDLLETIIRVLVGALDTQRRQPVRRM